MGTFVRVSALSGRLWAASAPLRASNPGKEEFLRPFALVSARLSAAVLEVFGSSPPRFRTTPQPSFGAAGSTTPIYRPIASQRNRAKQKCTGGVVLARSRPGGSGPDMGRRRCKLGRVNDPRCRLCYRGPPLPGELRAINPMSGAKRAAGDPCRTKSCSPQLGPHIRSRRRPERFGMGSVSRAARRRTQPTMPPPKRRLPTETRSTISARQAESKRQPAGRTATSLTPPILRPCAR